MTSALARLRPYQASAIDTLRRVIAGGLHRPLLYAPTGAGKTIIAAALIESARLRGNRVAFIVNRINLVEQTCAALTYAGIDHGVIQGDNSIGIHRPVLVCSIQTVAKRGLPDGINMVIIDEAHSVAGSSDYRKFIAKYNLLPMIGLSATPFSRGLGKTYPDTNGPLFHEIVVAATIAELIDSKHLVDCDIYGPWVPDLSGVKVIAGDYHNDQLAAVVDKPKLIGDIVAHWKLLACGQQTIVFATNIAHSRHICEEFDRSGIPAGHCDYRTPEDERQAIIANFKKGEITVLCNAGLFAEGFDAPATSCMILARPTKSLTRYIQMIGRVLRPNDGKAVALVLDHSGSCSKLGFPTDDLPLHLDDGKAREPKDSQRAMLERMPGPCPHCKYLKAPGVHVCPKCSFAPERQSNIVVGQGTLTKLVRTTAIAYSVEDKQRFYSELIGIQRETSRSDGWLAHTYHDKFGVWPREMQAIESVPSEKTRKFVTSKLIRFAKAKEAGGRHASA